MNYERVIIWGGDYTKSAGTERTDFSSFHKTEYTREIYVKNTKKDKNKNDVLNIKL